MNPIDKAFYFDWAFYGFGSKKAKVELAQKDMFFITMGKSFEVGYKVSSDEYDAHYTWAITPRIKDSLEKVIITLRATIEYKNQFFKGF